MGEKGFVSPNRAPRYVQSLYFVIVMKKYMLLSMFHFLKQCLRKIVPHIRCCKVPYFKLKVMVHLGPTGNPHSTH